MYKGIRNSFQNLALNNQLRSWRAIKALFSKQSESDKLFFQIFVKNEKNIQKELVLSKYENNLQSYITDGVAYSDNPFIKRLEKIMYPAGRVLDAVGRNRVITAYYNIIDNINIMGKSDTFNRYITYGLALEDKYGRIDGLYLVYYNKNTSMIKEVEVTKDLGIVLDTDPSQVSDQGNMQSENSSNQPNNSKDDELD